MDGNTEERRGTISVFNGPEPVVQVEKTPAAESAAAGTWMKERVAEGLRPHEIAVFVRSPAQLDRARQAVAKADPQAHELDDHVEPGHGKVSVGTMHLAKGLEFRAVVVMPATTRSSRSRSESSRSPTTPTWKRSTTRSATSSTSPAPAPATNS